MNEQEYILGKIVWLLAIFVSAFVLFVVMFMLLGTLHTRAILDIAKQTQASAPAHQLKTPINAHAIMNAE